MNMDFCPFTETREMRCPPMVEATVTTSTQDCRKKWTEIQAAASSLWFMMHNRNVFLTLSQKKR